MAAALEFTVDGHPVEVPDDGASLMEVLRDRLGIRSVKDGCSPQGQCGCCTVWVDGKPRVSCVTPARRVAGRAITTLAGLPAETRAGWGEAFCAAGASQCGFCTPGIVMRLAGLDARSDTERSRSSAATALAAHLCRCTGWQTILEAWDGFGTAAPDRNWAAAARRAELEGGVPQEVGTAVSLGEGGFADDTVPEGRWWRCPMDGVVGRWGRRWQKPEPQRARCRAGEPLMSGLCHWNSPTATGRCAFAPLGWSPPIWRPTPRGARPAVSRPVPWPTAARSGPRRRRRFRESPASWPTSMAVRSECCGRVRTPLDTVPSAPRSPLGSTPRAAG